MKTAYEVGLFNWNSEKLYLPISSLKKQSFLLFLLYIFISSIVLFLLMINNIETYTMNIVNYLDCLIMVMSIFAVSLLANRKIENWYLWIAIDLISIYTHTSCGIFILSIEYFIFTYFAYIGLLQWKTQLKKHTD